MARAFLDFEASEWTVPVAVGFVWGAPNARDSTYFIDRDKPDNVMRFCIDNMRMLAMQGIYEFWGHNAGKYDSLFILEYCTTHGLKLAGNVAAGRIIRLSIKLEGVNRLVNIYDSQAVVQSTSPGKSPHEATAGSLKKAAEAFELKSKKLLTADDYSIDAKLWSDETLRNGVLADCEVGLELIEKVETLAEIQGGKLKCTFSSIALSCLKSQVALPDARKWLDLNMVCREAYLGGRVEVFRHRPKEELTELDINSSYPWSMTQEMPWGYPLRKKSDYFAAQKPCIVDATVSVDKSCYLPVLPMCPDDGGVFFPVGEWRAYFTGTELRYAQKIGAATVQKMHSQIGFDGGHPFNEFVRSLYEGKTRAKGALKEFYKLNLNGCYGKFGQKPEKNTLVSFQNIDELYKAIIDAPDGTYTPLSPDLPLLALKEFVHWSSQTNYAIASHVTALSRVLLHQYMVDCEGLAYTDTDSLHCTKFRNNADALSNKLGHLKVEVSRLQGCYYAPKLYSLHNLDNNTWHFASKGFPVSAESFKGIVKGELSKRYVMQLAKSQLRSGGAVRRVEQVRHWRGNSSKRKIVSMNETVPWSVLELESGKYKNQKSPLYAP